MKADFTRRALLVALAGAIAVPGVAAAQDPRASEVQKAARDWLALADKLDGSATWKAAGKQFQAAMPEDRWTAQLKKAREARGKLVQRTAAATSFASQVPAIPDPGTYAMVRFRTSFANEPNATEDVTLEQTSGVWRVIGYVIR